jgi:dUTP pyrophosphatase
MIDVDGGDRIPVIKFSGPQPRYQTIGSAGADVSSSEDAVIPAGGWTIVPTGLFLEIPRGYECQVRSRSGLAAKEGVFVLNSPGTIDSDYRGEVKVILANMGKSDFLVNKGDRIAQLVFSPVVPVVFQSTSRVDFESTNRGSGGFGSTGK